MTHYDPADWVEAHVENQVEAHVEAHVDDNKPAIPRIPHPRSTRENGPRK